MDLLAVASGVASRRPPASDAAEAEPLFQINLFQVIIAAANFVVFLVLIWTFAFKPVAKMLADRKERIEQGLRDAEQARKDRESAEQERLAALQEARREANDILARAQKVAQETRERDIAATREELERMRVRATAEHRGREAARARRAARRGRRPRPPGRGPGRRRDDDRRAPAPARRGVPRRGVRRRRADGPQRLMAKRDSRAAALRRGRLPARDPRRRVDAWRRGPRPGGGRARRRASLMDVLANPALPARASAPRSLGSVLGEAVRRRVRNLVAAARPARPDRAAAARRGRVPPARRPAPGDRRGARDERRCR